MKFTATTFQMERRNTGKNGNSLNDELTGSIYYHGKGNRVAGIIGEQL